MSLNFNTEPYYDDFDEAKKFYRILYRPGFAVQARELTQMQTILQNQISRFGDHIFKEGAMVIPGQVSIDTKIQYVKLQSSFGGVLADTVIPNLIGLTIKNDAGLVAEVIHIERSAGADPSTLFVRYKNSADDNTTKVFVDGDVLEDLNGTFSVQADTVDATGVGSIATIQQGVYYIKGHFVLVEPQIIVLDKFSDIPSFRIGLLTKEEIITAEEDGSLFDNAQNSFNFAAPGAHRYFIGAVLTKLALDSIEDGDFIELFRTGEGQVKKAVRRTEYSVLEETFARRTFDESGNYTVRAFEIDVREHRNNNRGAWASNKVFLIGDVVTNDGKIYVAKNSGTSSSSTPPTHGAGAVFDGPGNTGIQWEYNEEPFFNRGIFSPSDSDNLSVQQESEAKLAVGLEPGKAYVQGYEIEKVSTEFVEVKKARDIVQVDNAVIPTTVGNFVLISNTNNLPPVGEFATVQLFDRITSAVGVSDGNVIGTARVRLMEFDSGTIGTQTAVYKLGLFDIKMNAGVDFNRRVKSFFFSRGDSNLNFSADISPVTRRLVGSATASSTTITGTGTSFQTDLIVGDFISLGGAVRRVTAISSQNSITVNTSTTVTGVTIDRLSTVIIEPENTTLIFPLPYYAIKDVRSALLTNDTIYTVYESFTGTATTSATPTLTVSTSSGTMASAALNTNYIVVDNSSSDGGAIVQPISITPTGSGVTFALASGLSGKSMLVIAAVNKSGAVLTEKTKTLESSETVTFTTAATAQKTELLLGKADGYRIVSVKMKSGTFAEPGAAFNIDISDRYEFDTGQRSTHYDVSRLLLKNSYAPPEAPVEVIFDYFTHSTGDYFTVNSYPANVDYKEIPSFERVSLRDSIDFRPRINDAGTAFSGTGASVSLVPKRGIDIVTDFTYHLARKTKVAVDFGGNFFAIDGVSSLNPGDPLDPALGLVLYDLTLEPFTFGTQSDNVQVKKIDTKRYTMRDIGRLEKRIDVLEYYTTLNLLEQQTESLDVIDANGDTRFKNGFIVDNFAGHTTGDTTSPDYVCAIDMEQGELRPFFSMQNINLLEKNSNNTQRNSSNYKLYGDVITLPVLEDLPFISQIYASRTENVNPFAVFTFLGDVKINPSSDDWFEVDRRPDLVVDVEGNFNTIRNISERAGVLGTVWNSWQTQWTGAPVVTGTTTTFQRQPRGWPIRRVTTQTTATQVGQSRSGTRTSLVTRIDRQVINDRVLSSASIPFIRSRNVLVQVKGLKPATRFFPFFDNIAITDQCTPASTIVYTPSGSTAAARLAAHNSFDEETNVGGLATATARRIDGDSQVCLNRGDIITGSTSGATAIVVGKEFNPDANTFALFVVNVKGSFTSNETLTGSVSGSTGSFGSIALGSLGSNITTNFNGQVNLLFNIPNTEALRFRSGTREFKLVDVPVANAGFTSRGRTNYRAEGILETRQQTVHAVRNAELVEEALADNRVITQSADRIVEATGWFDPLAQTFLVDERGGCFLSKVDIFFATKDNALPVTLEIREVVNGYPGKRVLPFSRITLKPEQINLSENTVPLDGVATNSFDTPTEFKFPSPVYVQENVEYAIILLSDSNQYNVWISQIGDAVPGTSRTISEQPYLGTLFKSQNASTWTPDQMQDLMFVLYRARFDTSVIGNVEYVNDAIPLQTIDFDPFETRAGQTKVRVWHRDHGMPVGSRVIISNVAGTVNNIPASELNATHIISDVDLDSYVITVTTAANASGYSGGVVRATRNLQFDGIQPAVQVQTFSETAVAFGLKTTTGKSVDSATQSPYVAEASFSGVLVNENNFLEQPRMIASEINETNSLGGNKSLTMNVTMSSTNDALSPILDTHRTSAIVYNNKVNNPSEVNMNVAGLDDNVILSNATGVSISGNTITTSTQNDAFLTATVGKFLTIAGASSGSSTRLIIAVAINGSSITFSDAPVAVTGNVTLTQRERFVDEIASVESSTHSKYLTKRVNLANSSNFLRIRFAANIPAEANVEVWFKTAVVGSTAAFETLPYTQVTPDAPIVNASNGSDRFFDVSYSEDNMQAFDAVQVKLVLKSTNSSEVPRIRDLRIIACA